MGCEFAQRREWTHEGELDWHLLGAPAHELDFGAFLKFLSDCAADPR